MASFPHSLFPIELAPCPCSVPPPPAFSSTHLPLTRSFSVSLGPPPGRLLPVHSFDLFDLLAPESVLFQVRLFFFFFFLASCFSLLVYFVPCPSATSPGRTLLSFPFDSSPRQVSRTTIASAQRDAKEPSCFDCYRRLIRAFSDDFNSNRKQPV